MGDSAGLLRAAVRLPAAALEETDSTPISGARIACSLDDLSACIAANGITLAAIGP
ncbi:hypothetical protein ACFV30_18850 [Streptomyces sp. NPDC059752]|uniref:hypothetical protein n=1 Tax=unclassified Streptomyces TaxID=2593676 RepID=UPI00365F170E